MFYDNKPQIKIGNNWSYDAWGLFLNSGWQLESAKPNIIMVDVPAGDGALDMSESLTGYPVYGNRNLKFELVFTQPETEWDGIRKTVENYCNGQRMNITLPHDQTHYLSGRISTGSLKRDKGVGSFDITAICDPWRYKNDITVVDITIGTTGVYTGVLTNERRRVIPEITTSATVDVTINGITESVSAGTFKFTDLVLTEGDNDLKITGPSGTTATIKYQEANF